LNARSECHEPYDYEKKFFPIYEAFAETVRFILEKALRATENLHRPQSIQCRAKGIESVRRYLAEKGKLGTQTLELDRRDLAGDRLIFYTNNDIDRQSDLTFVSTFAKPSHP
jgi:hypothetical protein